MTHKMHWQVLDCAGEIGGKCGACYQAFSATVYIDNAVSIWNEGLLPSATIAGD
jgi:hypothetical protein